MLNLRELICGNPVRLRYVVRFSTCHKTHQESVAEHSYYVALYAMFVGDWCKANWFYDGADVVGAKVDMDLLLRKALLHDLEESVTGDVPRIFKYSSPEIRASLEEASKSSMARLLLGVWGVAQRESANLIDLYREYWEYSKDCSIEGRIIAFCDYLSVLSYMMQELTNANITMREHWETMKEYQKLFDDGSYDFIRPLVIEAHTLLTIAFQEGSKRGID